MAEATLARMKIDYSASLYVISGGYGRNQGPGRIRLAEASRPAVEPLSTTCRETTVSVRIVTVVLTPQARREDRGPVLDPGDGFVRRLKYWARLTRLAFVNSSLIWTD
jgi:hypothetical protein